MDIDQTLIKSFIKTKGSHQDSIHAAIADGFEPLCESDKRIIFSRKDAQWFIKKLIKLRKSSMLTHDSRATITTTCNPHIKIGFVTHGTYDYAEQIVKALLGVTTMAKVYHKIDFFFARGDCSYELQSCGHKEIPELQHNTSCNMEQEHKDDNKNENDDEDDDCDDCDDCDDFDEETQNRNDLHKVVWRKHFDTIKAKIEFIHFKKIADEDFIFTNNKTENQANEYNEVFKQWMEKRKMDNNNNNNRIKTDHRFIFIDDSESLFLRGDKQTGFVPILPFKNYKIYDKNDKIIAKRLNKHDYQLRKIYQHIIQRIVKYNFKVVDLASKQVATVLNKLYDIKRNNDVAIDWNNSKLTQLGNKTLKPLKQFMALIDVADNINKFRHLYVAAVRLYLDVSQQVLLGGPSCRHSYVFLAEVYHVNIVDLQKHYDYFVPFIMSACMYLCIRMNENYNIMRNADKKLWKSVIKFYKIWYKKNGHNDDEIKNSKMVKRMKLRQYVEIVKLFMVFPPIFPGLIKHNDENAKENSKQTHFFHGFEKYCERNLFSN